MVIVAGVRRGSAARGPGRGRARRRGASWGRAGPGRRRPAAAAAAPGRAARRAPRGTRSAARAARAPATAPRSPQTRPPCTRNAIRTTTFLVCDMSQHWTSEVYHVLLTILLVKYIDNKVAAQRKGRKNNQTESK